MNEFTLKNQNGMTVTCLDYGCIITGIFVPDQDGRVENVVLAYDDHAEYKKNPWYLGAVIGRTAGRISGASFDLNGKTYELEKNDNGNTLHGGSSGFHQAVWHVAESSQNHIRFTHTSPDGEGGFPGTVTASVTYTVTDNNELVIEYKAETDKATPLTLTNHSYFNLSGNVKRSVADHVLTIDSSQFAELKEGLLPTGTLKDVEGTAFDFRSGRPIQEGIESDDPQNKLAGGGYDHPFVLGESKKIHVLDPENGRALTVATTEPCVVLYTSSQMEDGVALAGGESKQYGGLCLETQGAPDAIHHPHFPQHIITPEAPLVSKSVFQFHVHKADGQ